MPDQFSWTANVNSFWSHQMEGKEEVNILKSQINEERTYTRNEQLGLEGSHPKGANFKVGQSYNAEADDSGDVDNTMAVWYKDDDSTKFRVIRGW